MLQYGISEVQKYNSMRDLSVADYSLSIRENNAIDRLLAIIKNNGMEDFIGIKLLHKHNKIAIDKVMVEDHIVDKTGFFLVTKATSIALVTNDYVPNSWILSDLGFIPVEFSYRRLISNDKINPANNFVLFRQIEDEIRALNLDEIVGPSLLSSSFIERHRPEGSSMMIEVTDDDDRANILRFILANENAQVIGKAIQTHWRIQVSGDKDASLTVKTCTKICPAIGNPPKHQGTYIHQQPNN